MAATAIEKKEKMERREMRRRVRMEHLEMAEMMRFRRQLQQQPKHSELEPLAPRSQLLKMIPKAVTETTITAAKKNLELSPLKSIWQMEKWDANMNGSAKTYEDLALEALTDSENQQVREK